MKAHLHGCITGPAVAVIGVWDPLLPAHRELLERLCSHARQTSQSALAITIDPDPVQYLWGPCDLPVYHDVHVRSQQMLRCGLDGVLRVRFARRDIDATAADFFAALDPLVRIAELWLGARQTLGRLEGGNFDAITRLAEARQMCVRRLPPQRLEARQVRDLLRTGHLEEAARVVGAPPIHRRPESGKLRLAWRPGLYQALPLPSPDAALEGVPLTLPLRVRPRARPVLDWPGPHVPYLAFVSGPEDVC